jgi:hypothetical protein
MFDQDHHHSPTFGFCFAFSASHCPSTTIKHMAIIVQRDKKLIGICSCRNPYSEKLGAKAAESLCTPLCHEAESLLLGQDDMLPCAEMTQSTR